MAPRPSYRHARRALVLALPLALSSCFTAMVWCDSGHLAEEPMPPAAPDCRAFLEPPPESGIWLDAPAALREHLRVLCPDQPADARWFKVDIVPRSAAASLATAGTGQLARLQLRERRGEPPWLILFTAGQTPVGSAAESAPPGGLGFALAKVTPMPPPATVPGPPLPALRFEHVRLVQHDPNVFAQVAMTPFAVALDVVLLPLEAIGYLVLLGSGYHG